ncbi:ABC transporter permease [Catenulispora pinisilvae]|uniref:ABC transporter permease n=1 Tax=Catenulispora pinisilvae TaxID=2705253 RepID=UPI00189153F2|nr:ABC transporter permease [Catenulispora pinisilvae]
MTAQTGTAQTGTPLTVGPARTADTPFGRAVLALRDGRAIVLRNLSQMRHAPGEIVGAVLFPIIMVVIFGYIFGSAISVPGGGDYRDFLMPGMFAMTATFSVIVTMNKVAADNGKGVMDRFRSMPMARSAVPFGQTGADLIMSVLGFAIMSVVGLVVGWRMHDGAGSALAAFGLILLFAYALHWVGVLLGLMFKNESTADRMTPLVFPVTMLSNSFVPTTGMPAWLRVIADWNPVSSLTQAARHLFGSPGAVTSHAWPMQHPVPAALMWAVVILGVCVPLAVRRYQRAGR